MHRIFGLIIIKRVLYHIFRISDNRCAVNYRVSALNDSALGYSHVTGDIGIVNKIWPVHIIQVIARVIIIH